MTMNLTVLMNNQKYWIEVHRTGCADLRKVRDDPHGLKWTETHGSRTAAAASIASDFIAEESMTIDDALRDIHFAPCVTLPLENADA